MDQIKVLNKHARQRRHGRPRCTVNSITTICKQTYYYTPSFISQNKKSQFISLPYREIHQHAWPTTEDNMPSPSMLKSNVHTPPLPRRGERGTFSLSALQLGSDGRGNLKSCQTPTVKQAPQPFPASSISCGFLISQPGNHSENWSGRQWGQAKGKQ